MLVLSRKPGERILIGEEIRLTVIRIGQHGVRIGIDAPPHLSIVREELLLAEGVGGQELEIVRAECGIDLVLDPQSAIKNPAFGEGGEDGGADCVAVCGGDQAAAGGGAVAS